MLLNLCKCAISPLFCSHCLFCNLFYVSCPIFYLNRLEENVSYLLNAYAIACVCARSAQSPLAAIHPLRFHCKFSTFASPSKSCRLFLPRVCPPPTVSSSRIKEKQIYSVNWYVHSPNRINYVLIRTVFESACICRCCSVWLSSR